MLHSMDKTLNGCNESFQTEEFQGCDSHSLTRQREMGVNIGTARKEQHTKYAQILINQTCALSLLNAVGSK
uniref:Uncharacterized protein n=1 Tax=Arion vulgaris TaxID=1028688 RepID=A0A0B7B243_9EUPU